MNIYYLGLREKTVQYTKFFKDLILVKSGETPSLLCYEDIMKEQIDYNLLENFIPISNFYDKMIEKVCLIDNKALFMPYNQATQEHLKNKNKLICINNLELIKSLNNKPKSREMLKGVVKCLDYLYVKGKDITFKKINSLFKGVSTKYVVQEFVGFGGIGTFVLSEANENEILKELNPENYYSISKYFENIVSANSTFMIGDEILIFESSIQKILKSFNLLYNGWDFEQYEKLDKSLKNKIYKQTYDIAKKLKEMGYVGVGGVDYIIKEDEVYFIEINPRFQVSSEALDKSLQEKNFPSIFELQYLCFCDREKFNYWSKIISQKIE